MNSITQGEAEVQFYLFRGIDAALGRAWCAPTPCLRILQHLLRRSETPTFAMRVRHTWAFIKSHQALPGRWLPFKCDVDSSVQSHRIIFWVYVAHSSQLLNLVP